MRQPVVSSATFFFRSNRHNRALNCDCPRKVYQLSRNLQMASTDKPNQSSRLDYWEDRWDDRHLGFHQSDVHKMLVKHLDKLMPESRPNKIFLPLCGKSLDLKWLADRGLTVVGVEGVRKAIEEFFTEQNTEWTEENVPKLGDKAQLLKSKDGKIRLYKGDMMDFTKALEGTFDAVWDRASFVAMNRKDLPGYVKIMKDIMSPNGRMLLEVMEYDVSIMEDVEGPTKPPPPHPMYEDELKSFYEPECTVEFVDRAERKLAGKDIHLAIYLVVKKS